MKTGEVCFFPVKVIDGGIVGFIHCCGGLRKSNSFVLAPEYGFLVSELDYLETCPVCNHTVVQFTRIDIENNIRIIRKNNFKARILYEKLKHSILYEKKAITLKHTSSSRFYLYYNEYGKKKRCYSNISTLKIGRFEMGDFEKENKLQLVCR